MITIVGCPHRQGEHHEENDECAFNIKNFSWASFDLNIVKRMSDDPVAMRK